MRAYVSGQRVWAWLTYEYIHDGGSETNTTQTGPIQALSGPCTVHCVAEYCRNRQAMYANSPV